jgi:hypothetical protein
MALLWRRCFAFLARFNGRNGAVPGDGYRVCRREGGIGRCLSLYDYGISNYDGPCPGYRDRSVKNDGYGLLKPRCKHTYWQIV